jgi:hypothetical protein
MEVTALVLGIVGAVTGLGSLAWQVITWRQGGRRVKVTATQALPVFGSGASDWYMNVTASNVGRSPVTVRGWGLRMPDGKTMIMPSNLSWSASLPHRLEPGADASWYMPTTEVHKFCAEHGIRHQDMTAFVNLADGRTINARERGIGLA